MIVDLEDPASVTRFSHELVNGSWHPEILILNGGGPKPGSIATLQLEDWDRAYQSTFRSMLSLAYAVLPGMRTAKWGRIVALTSTTVKQPIANMPLSNSFRIALLSTMKTLAGDVAHEGITVNSIATGRIRTDRLRELYGSDAAMDSAATNEIPIGRVAEPEEFAPLVTFLCGEPARYITGQTIAIDGGLVRGIFG